MREFRIDDKSKYQLISKIMLKKRLVLFIMTCVTTFSVFAQEITEVKKESLARISILPFYDHTGTQDFGYLPGSLREAIVQSMHKKFEFVETPEKEMLVVFPESNLENRNDENLIKKSAATLNSDIIIYGEFEFDKKTDKVTIKPKIYFAPIKENAGLEHVTNPVDNTIFQVTEKVADNINKEINRMLDIYAKKSQSTVATVNDKKVINRESMEVRGMVWAIGGAGQLILNPVKGTTVGFFGFSGEQYFSPLFSGYGSLSFGISNAGTMYVKIPAVGVFAILGSMFAGNFGLLVTTPGIMAMDGMALNFKIGDVFQVAPYLGLTLALPLNMPILTDSIFGAEGGVRFNYYIGQRLRAGLSAGTYFSFADFSFAYNASLSFSYLTGK